MVLSPDNISGFSAVAGSNLSTIALVWDLGHMIFSLKICKNLFLLILGELLADSMVHNGIVAKHYWDLELIMYKNKKVNRKKRWVFLRVNLPKLFFNNCKKALKKIWNSKGKALINWNLSTIKIWNNCKRLGTQLISN
jgi:hypothetical protein